MQPPTIIHNKPDVASYTPLADYQASTPATFYDSKPVLHYHTENAYALIASEQLLDLPIFTGPESTARSATAINGKNIYKVALFVNSAYVTTSSIG